MGWPAGGAGEPRPITLAPGSFGADGALTSCNHSTGSAPSPGNVGLNEDASVLYLTLSTQSESTENPSENAVPYASGPAGFSPTIRPYGNG